ncbi:MULTISPECIES: hypothetical protein [unclassified Chryseobacterium]|uniref:hypothetical protein n=1 Tax=unclassified Chryseobacterium TaxID=2593645 RepID=UPI0030172C77
MAKKIKQHRRIKKAAGKFTQKTQNSGLHYRKLPKVSSSSGSLCRNFRRPETVLVCAAGDLRKLTLIVVCPAGISDDKNLLQFAVGNF